MWHVQDLDEDTFSHNQLIISKELNKIFVDIRIENYLLNHNDEWF